MLLMALDLQNCKILSVRLHKNGAVYIGAWYTRMLLGSRCWVCLDLEVGGKGGGARLAGTKYPLVITPYCSNADDDDGF